MEINKQTETVTEFEIVTLKYVTVTESSIDSNDSNSSLCSDYVSTDLIQESVELVSADHSSPREMPNIETNSIQDRADLYNCADVSTNTISEYMENMNTAITSTLREYNWESLFHCQLQDRLNHEEKDKQSVTKERLNGEKERLFIDTEEERFSSDKVSNQEGLESCTDATLDKNFEMFPSTQDEESTSKTSDEISCKCTICNNVFNSLNALITHLSCFHSEKDLINELEFYNECFNVKMNAVSRVEEITVRRRNKGNHYYQVNSQTCSRNRRKRSESYSANASAEDSRLLHSTEGEGDKLIVSGEGSMKCVICEKVFRNKKSLKIHQRLSHTNHIEYSSAICNKSSNFKNTLGIQRKNHSEPKRKCDHCNKFYSFPGLQYHLKVLNNQRPHKCSFCSKSFVLRSRLDTHIDNKHRQDTTQLCDRCGKLLNGTGHLTKHMQTHSERDTLSKEELNLRSDQNSHHSVSCRECGISYNHYKNLFVHFKKKHGEKLKDIPKGFIAKYILKEEECRLVCEYCLKVFRNNQYFQHHRKSHLDGPKYACNYCKKKYNLKGTLKRHIRKYHSAAEQEHCTLFCEYCGEAFQNSYCFKFHLKSHRHETHVCPTCGMECYLKSALLKHMRENHVKKQDVHACTVCSKEFSLKNSLQRHIRKRHNVNKGRLFCEFCPKVFQNHQNFQFHLKSHRPKNNACTLCEKKYYLKSSLQKHIKECHSAHEDTLVCEHCARVFRHQAAFQFHLDSHRYKTQVCKDCGKEYYFKRSLQEHIKNNHKAIPEKYLCNDCGKEYRYQNSWRRHITKCHSVEQET